ncbi:MAG: PQQ-like beta-propeller repeat protein, partial [Thermoplasmata archaeon]|nr:PQQ-like beta-propeller repeat protein [Thermoplasmata archaeon]
MWFESPPLPNKLFALFIITTCLLIAPLVPHENIFLDSQTTAHCLFLSTSTHVCLHSTTSLMNSYDFPSNPWPMPFHDPQHTGRSQYSTASNPYRIQWNISLGDPNTFFGDLVIDSSGILYAPIWNVLYAIAPNGTIKWRFIPPLPPSDTTVRSSMISDEGIIYVVVYDFYYKYREGSGLYAIYPNNGTVKWVFSPVFNNTRYNIYGLTVTSDNRIIAISDGPGGYYLYALLPNGSLLWRSNTPIPRVRFYPAIDGEGNIYCT